VEGAVEDVRVDAESATTGVVVTAPGARLVRVDVAGAAGAALEVMVTADPATAATVEVLGGSYRASDVGIWIRGGRVSVAPDPAYDSGAVASENPGSTIVAGNVRDGVVVGGRAIRGYPVTMTNTDAILERVSIDGNDGTGIIVAGLPPTSRVLIRACDVWSNGALDPTLYGMPSRYAAGVLVSLASSVGFGFRTNRVWSNAGDQLAFESSSAWSIAAPTCGADTNVFDCIPGNCNESGGICAVSIVGGGSVQASKTNWPGDAGGDQYATMNVVAGVYTPDCCWGGAGEPPIPACP
jgi:hypothetical protein